MENVWHARAERQTREMQQTYWYELLIQFRTHENVDEDYSNDK